MDQKFLKRFISECPLTDFSENGNVTERESQLDKYLEQFTSFLYANENQLIQHFWQEYIASSEIVLLQNSEMLRRCFIFLDCAVVIYKDELPPRIVVQVKSYDRDVPEKDVQALKGAMHNNDYGLFVTLSDYTENAKKYLNDHTEIRGISGSELVDLLLQYYDKLSDKYRAIIPLKKVYIPDVSES